MPPSWGGGESKWFSAGKALEGCLVYSERSVTLSAAVTVVTASPLTFSIGLLWTVA